MSQQQPLSNRVAWVVIRAAIRLSDWARSTAPVFLLTAIMLAGGALWLASGASAHAWVWKSWERMFGPAATAGAGQSTHAQPETPGTSGNFTVVTIDDPSAGASATEGTFVIGVNASGAMTGAYSDQVGVGHGFVYANGTFTSFDAPDAGSNPPAGWLQGTVGIGMDTAGDVAGIYADNNNAVHSFLRAANGTITEFDDPNAPTDVSSRGTMAMAINDSGQIVGTYTTGSYDTNSAYRGFLRSADGSFTAIDAPGAGTGESANNRKQGTIAAAINTSGAITGFYVDSSNNRHGFIYSAGTYTSFDVPGATTTTQGGGTFSGTVPMSIDTAGDVVGSYTDSQQVRHGFLRLASGTITTFDAPGAGTSGASGAIGGTFPTRIDPTASYIAGVYDDSTGLGHGFVDYLPLTSSSSFTTFTPPNETTSTSGLPIQGAVLGVNASGTVVGFYLDSTEVAHGFEYTPTPTPAPTFSPAQGAYSSEQSVAISDTDSSATIYYTTDGSIPTVASTQYTEPITVSSTETINAIALDTSSGGYIESAVASATYTIAASGFTLSASPTSVAVVQGNSATSTITVTDMGAFSGDVALSAGGLPSGVTASFATGSGAGTQVITFAATASAAVTSSPVTITVTGSSGSLSAATTIALTVTGPPFTGGSGGTTSISLAPGSTTGNTGTISVMGTNGFSGTVNLTCAVTTSMTNVNDMPTCSLNPASVTLSGTTAQTSTLTVTTTAASSAKNELQKLLGPMTGGTALALAVFFLVPRRRRNWLAMLGLLLLLVSAGATSCGGGGNRVGGNSGTTAGSYTITVTGTSGTISATVGTIALTVQ